MTFSESSAVILIACLCKDAQVYLRQIRPMRCCFRRNFGPLGTESQTHHYFLVCIRQVRAFLHANLTIFRINTEVVLETVCVYQSIADSIVRFLKKQILSKVFTVAIAIMALMVGRKR